MTTDNVLTDVRCRWRHFNSYRKTHILGNRREVLEFRLGGPDSAAGCVGGCAGGKALLNTVADFLNGPGLHHLAAPAKRLLRRVVEVVLLSMGDIFQMSLMVLIFLPLALISPRMFGILGQQQRIERAPLSGISSFGSSRCGSFPIVADAASYSVSVIDTATNIAIFEQIAKESLQDECLLSG
jgi:hypothetical protein